MDKDLLAVWGAHAPHRYDPVLPRPLRRESGISLSRRKSLSASLGRGAWTFPAPAGSVGNNKKKEHKLSIDKVNALLPLRKAYFYQTGTP